MRRLACHLNTIILAFSELVCLYNLAMFGSGDVDSDSFLNNAQSTQGSLS